jgi:hypothetical protein
MINYQIWIETKNVELQFKFNLKSGMIFKICKFELICEKMNCKFGTKTQSLKHFYSLGFKHRQGTKNWKRVPYIFPKID